MTVVFTSQDIGALIIIGLFLVVLLICWIGFALAAIRAWAITLWGQIRYRFGRKR